MTRKGITLIEVIAAISIIAILAAILLPIVGHAKRTALKRRAMMEMQSIRVAGLQFYADHGFMPWGDPTDPTQTRTGEDKWTSTGVEQANVMRWLTGENPIKKSYLQIPEKSRSRTNPLIFVDPWGQDYHIGMDRDLNGAVLPDATFCGHDYINERILVYTLGDPDGGTLLKTF